MGADGRAVHLRPQTPGRALVPRCPADTREEAAARRKPCPRARVGSREKACRALETRTLGFRRPVTTPPEKGRQGLWGRDLAVAGRMGKWWEGRRRPEREHFINI